MDTIFMNSKNCGTSDPPRLLINLKDKIKLSRSDTHVVLSSFSIYYTWKNIKTSSPTWNEEFELSDGLYSVSDIQDYFEYILKKTWRKY